MKIRVVQISAKPTDNLLQDSYEPKLKFSMSSYFCRFISRNFQDRQVCKVKCTSNEMFKIRPPVFALKPGEEGIVKVFIHCLHTVKEIGSRLHNYTQKLFPHSYFHA